MAYDNSGCNILISLIDVISKHRRRKKKLNEIKNNNALRENSAYCGGHSIANSIGVLIFGLLTVVFAKAATATQGNAWIALLGLGIFFWIFFALTAIGTLIAWLSAFSNAIRQLRFNRRKIGKVALIFWLVATVIVAAAAFFLLFA